MLLLVLRHATAVPSGTPGYAEDARPLDAEGEREARVAGEAFRRLGVQPPVFVTSPLPRARRTAELAAEAVRADVVDDPVLASGFQAPDLAGLLGRHVGDPLAIVGHDPDFSDLVQRLTGARVRMPKGGVAAVSLERRDATQGELRYLLRPRQLRAIVEAA